MRIKERTTMRLKAALSGLALIAATTVPLASIPTATAAEAPTAAQAQAAAAAKPVPPLGYSAKACGR